MDFSNKYIIMCKNAKEIQEEWKKKEGDWVFYKNTIHLIHFQPLYGSLMLFYNELIENWGICDETIHKYQQPVNQSEIIWLPTQDQLQKLFFKHLSPITILKNFCKWCEKYNDYTKKFNSMEQLWLAFIMWEKFNKFWYYAISKWIKRGG